MGKPIVRQGCVERDGLLSFPLPENGALTLDVEFFLCPSEVISFIAAYSLPTRFSHGASESFRKLVLQQRHGLACIHELVYFRCPARLLYQRAIPVENMIAAAHVIAHADFFKNNVNF